MYIQYNVQNPIIIIVWGFCFKSFINGLLSKFVSERNLLYNAVLLELDLSDPNNKIDKNAKKMLQKNVGTAELNLGTIKIQLELVGSMAPALIHNFVLQAEASGGASAL